MAVAEMKKLNLAAMSYERDGILNALQRTGAVELKTHTAVENASSSEYSAGALDERLARVEWAIEFISAQVESYDKENKIKSDTLADGFKLSYSDFFAARELGGEADEIVSAAESLNERIKELLTKQKNAARAVKNAEIYSAVKEPLNSFKSTAHVEVKLGTVPAAEVEKLKAAEEELCAFNVLGGDGEKAVVVFVYHKSAQTAAEEILRSAGFTACNLEFGNRSGREIYLSLVEEERECQKALNEAYSGVYALGKSLKTLKVYCDYLNFELEKAKSCEKTLSTASTFLLEAYVPAEAEVGVKEALDGVSDAIYYEFSKPAEDEIPPTLYKNSEVVKNFESITDMYSPVNSREFDPNTVMAFFYSVFLGFIMGDVGYGLLMFFGGGAIYLKNRDKDNAIKRLAGVFAIGGICAILWGLLFNSVFGIAISAMPTVMPDAQRDMWTFIGISVPAVLVISLELGIVQLFAGYICRAVQHMRRGNILDGIFEGLTWAVFSLGVGLAIVGFVEESGLKILGTVGGITAGVSLLAAVLTAGRKEKFFGKFTKGFGAAYGVINYASDILSYARLYGLMLSGAVIAQIVSQYAVQFMTGGNAALAILGAVLMVVGHAFNLAMGLLGAYIHDARLQYVEFYGRFFEGEGELFKPLGSEHKYINLYK